MPAFQMVYNELSVEKSDGSLTISYRPNNCTVGIPDISVRQAVDNVIMKKKTCVS
jgi:hypothetical protein